MPQGGMGEDPREMDARQANRTDGGQLEGAAADAESAAGSGTPAAETAGSDASRAAGETVAPEEEGGAPATEHGPGADL